MPSTFEGVSGDPLLGFTHNGEQGLEIIETERGPIAPFTGLIFERPREGRCEERTLLAAILLDRRFDVAASQHVRGLFVGSHLVSSLLKCALALSQEEESQCTFQGGNWRQKPSPACRRGSSGGSYSETGASVAPRRCEPVGLSGSYENNLWDALQPKLRPAD